MFTPPPTPTPKKPNFQCAESNSRLHILMILFSSFVSLQFLFPSSRRTLNDAQIPEVIGTSYCHFVTHATCRAISFASGTCFNCRMFSSVTVVISLSIVMYITVHTDIENWCCLRVWNMSEWFRLSSPEIWLRQKQFAEAMHSLVDSSGGSYGHRLGTCNPLLRDGKLRPRTALLI